MSPLRTYKFLTAGARGPISGFQWPLDGAWVETTGALEPCLRGAHVCRPGDLPYWLHDELWEAEIAGDRLEGIDCVVVARARLVRRIDTWQRDGARSFVAACVQHAHELVASADASRRELAQGYLDDAHECADAGIVAFGAFSSAVAVGKLTAEPDALQAYRRERAWQAEWLQRCVLAGN